MVASDETFEPSAARLAEYRLDDTEPVSEALVEAFDRADARDVDDPSALYDWLEPDALDLLFRHSGGDPQVLVELWDHPVHISRDTVTIYETDQA